MCACVRQSQVWEWRRGRWTHGIAKSPTNTYEEEDSKQVSEEESGGKGRMDGRLRNCTCTKELCLVGQDSDDEGRTNFLHCTTSCYDGAWMHLGDGNLTTTTC